MLAGVDLLAKPYTPDPALREKRRGVDSEFGEIFDVLCEELDLDQIDTREAIGYYLKNEDEGRSLAELAALLQAVWDEAEKYASNPAFPTDDEFRRAPSWPKVVDSARRAQGALVR